MSYVDLKYDITLWEYYCMLAEAAEARRDEDFSQAQISAIAYHNPKYLKRWQRDIKKQRQVGVGKEAMANSLVSFAMAAAGGDMRPTGNAIEFARATGRPIAYQQLDGSLLDEAGNPTERNALTIIIPVEQSQ